jgi:uncharacterized protein YcaQ
MRTPATSPRPQASVSADEAREIAVHAQGFSLGAGSPKTAGEVLRRLGAVQLDTISVLARSHELVAYARAGAVGRAAVEDAYWGTPPRAFEYWAHANCVLPVESWPYFAFRRAHIPGNSWANVPESAITEVRARLRDGPVTVGDLGGARQAVAGWWNWSDAKHAVELLLYRGEVVCTTRRNWKRVYDLPERALPPEVLAAEPSPAACYAYLVGVAAKARGVATRRDLGAYFRLLERRFAPALDRDGLLDDAIAANGLVPVEVEGWKDLAFADAAQLAPRGPLRHRPVLLSPFDSLVWADAPVAGSGLREYTQRLFGYSYSLELYKPKHAREHGYFTMPLLAGGRIAGHVDPAREGRTLVARGAALFDEGAVPAMAAALREAAAWVGCDDVRAERVKPRALTTALRRALRDG